MSKLVSFLIPSRKRPHGMDRAIDSIIATASQPSRVEILFLLDEDDEESINAAQLLADPMVQFFVTPRIGNGYEHLYHYYNQLYSQATGEFLFIFNDDTVMTSHGWDDVLARYSGQCVVLDPKWNYSAPYATFPIVSRQFPERMGVFCEHVYIDRWFSFIADACGKRILAQDGDDLIELNHVGDTDRRNNGGNGEYPQLSHFFVPPDFDMARIEELALKVRG